MFSKVSVLVPTRHRVQRLKTLFDSYDRTVLDSRQAELVFRVDDDDAESQKFLAGQQLVIGPRHLGYDSMPQFFNEMLSVATGDVFVCGNDDMVFQTEGWEQHILDAANKYPDGIFDFGVSTHNESHYPFSIVSRKVTDHLGFLWDPQIFWGDIYLRDVMQFFGRSKMLHHVRIDHDWAGFKPDATFYQADKNIEQRVPGYWNDVHVSAVQRAIERLKEIYQAEVTA